MKVVQQEKLFESADLIESESVSVGSGQRVDFVLEAYLEGTVSRQDANELLKNCDTDTLRESFSALQGNHDTEAFEALISDLQASEIKEEHPDTSLINTWRTGYPRVENAVNHYLSGRSGYDELQIELKDVDPSLQRHVLYNIRQEVIRKGDPYCDYKKLEKITLLEKSTLSCVQFAKDSVAEHREPKNLIEDGRVALESVAWVRIQKANYPPTINSEGDVVLRSPFAETVDNSRYANWKPRSSIHGSLNGSVVAHSGGDWSDNPYVLIGNLAAMIERNGNPAALNGVDTYFTQEELTLPGARVVEPAARSLRGNSGEFYSVGTPVTLYQRETFTPGQVKNMIEYALLHKDVDKDCLARSLKLVMQRELGEATAIERQRDLLLHAFDKVQGDSVFQSLLNHDIHNDPEVRKGLNQFSRDVAVRETLQSDGYEIMHIGARSWGSSVRPSEGAQQALGKTAVEVGVEFTGLHSDSNSAYFDKALSSFAEYCLKVKYEPSSSEARLYAGDLEACIAQNLQPVLDLADKNQGYAVEKVLKKLRSNRV